MRGIVHRPEAQLVLVDTPGLHKPRTLLGERLNDVVRTTWAEVDVIGFCVPADQKIGPGGDRFIAAELAELKKRTPKVAVVTKTDLVSQQALAQQLLAVDQLGRELGIEWAEIVPVSGTEGSQVDLLADLLVPLLPEGPPLYPDGDLTDEPEQVMVAELIREAALEGVRDELPHSIAVVVEEMVPPRGPARRPAAARRPRQHLPGAAQPEGHRHRPQGQAPQGGRQHLAAAHIEALLGTPVYLDLHVKVAKDWQRDPKQLRRLGF